MKKIDDSGYWILKANPISQIGVFPYLGRQIDLDGSMGLPKDKVFGVFRPPGELFSPDTLESMDGIPLIDEHEMLGEGFTPVEKRAPQGTITNVRPSQDLPGVLVADIKIYTKSLKDKIERGKKGLSLGYFCSYRPERGVFDGKPYDFVQTDMRGNHIALVANPRNGVYVQDSAIGKSVFAIDSAIEEINPMKKPEERLAELLDGKDAETCKAVCDFLDDYLAKKARRPAADGEEAAPGERDIPAPPPKAAKSADPADGDGETAPDGDAKPDPEDDAKPDPEDAKDNPPTEDCGDVCDDCGKPKKDCKCAKGGKPSKGGACDEALRKEMFRQFAKARDLYDRVSPFVGTFDSGDMGEAEIAAYACKKLGVAFDEAAPETAVFAISAALKFAKAPSAAPGSTVPVIDSADTAKSPESDTRKCAAEYFGE